MAGIDEKGAPETGGDDDGAEADPERGPSPPLPVARGDAHPPLGDDHDREQRQGKQLEQGAHADEGVYGAEAAPLEQPDAGDHHEGGQQVVAEEQGPDLRRQGVDDVGPGLGVG
jgi:hypothetical protein